MKPGPMNKLLKHLITLVRPRSLRAALGHIANWNRPETLENRKLFYETLFVRDYIFDLKLSILNMFFITRRVVVELLYVVVVVALLYVVVVVAWLNVVVVRRCC